MNQTELLYWLQGMLEYTDIPKLSEEDAKTKLQGIKDHLSLVFKKVTPTIPAPGISTPVPTPIIKEERTADDWHKIFKKHLEKGFPNRPLPFTPTPFHPQDGTGVDPRYWLDRMPTDFGDEYYRGGYDPSGLPKIYC